VAEQAQNTPSDAECNVNLYPYDSIRLELRDLLAKFAPDRELGKNCVPLVINWATKGPFFENWTTLTWDELCSQDLCTSKGAILIPAGQYLRYLFQRQGKHNVGIRLGPKSGNLGNFDIDTVDRRVIDALLHFCPRLADTFWTKGSSTSGCALWFRMKGEWPSWAICRVEIEVPGVLGKPDKDGKPGRYALEFRTSGAHQNVVWGLHKNEKDFYTACNRNPILEFEFEEFKNLMIETGKLGWQGWPGIPKTRASRAGGRWRNDPLEWSSGSLEEKLVILEEELGYEILDVDETRGRVAIRCVNEAEHTDDTGEFQTVVFIGTDERATVAYCCKHSHCEARDDATGASVNREQTRRIHRAFAKAKTIFFALGNENLHQTYATAYARMRDSGEFFNLNGQIVRWRNGWDKVLPINAARLHPALNELGIAITQELKGGKIAAKKLAGQDANDLTDQPVYIEGYFPKIKFISPVPFLCWNEEARESYQIQYGFNPGLGCLCLSQQNLIPMSATTGLQFLDEHLLNFWRFETPADRSRALSMVFSIAECLGHWHRNRGPFHLVLADDRLAGKTLLPLCIGAIFGIEVKTNEYDPKTGIDGTKERFNRSLAEGSFVHMIDNIRGDFDMPLFEVLATGSNQVDYRLPYGRPSTGSVEWMTFFFTGNEGVQFHADMTSRFNVIKILVQEGHNFQDKEKEAFLLNVIRENALPYQSAVAAVLAEYGAAGAPKRKYQSHNSAEAYFRFVDWTEMNNGLLGYTKRPYLTDGLSERQYRAANRNVLWAEKVWSMLINQPQLLDRAATPSRWGNEFIELGLELPFDLKFASTDKVLGGKMSKFFKRDLPQIIPGKLAAFGPAFVHVWHDPADNRDLFYISQCKEPINEPNLL
jgi:hypothetical protein